MSLLSNEKIIELWKANAVDPKGTIEQFSRAIEAAVREEQSGEIARLRHDVDKYKFAFLDWSDKTEWVQQDAHNLFDFALGMHRADAMRKLIEKLREANAELLEGLATYKKHLMHCDRLDYHDSGRGECTCGLEALITKHGGK